MTIPLKEMLNDPETVELAETFLSLYMSGALTAPNKVFPQDTVGRVYERAAKFLDTFPKKGKRTLYQVATPIADTYIDSYYSFTDNLRTGDYAPYPHEQTELNMSGNNCTTIIPEVYLFCEAVGLKPEIVQFFDFQDIKNKKDQQEVISPSHYSLIIDVGRKHQYLFDPFYHTFGPIREQGEDYIKVGKCRGRPARKRIFRKILPYSAHDFVQMMDRLHDPAESLDMLIAGQKVHSSKTVPKTNGCTLMVYYHDGNNSISTRLYIPQKPLTDKVVYAHMALNDGGIITKLILECYLAKDSGWDSLVDPKKVCETDFSTALLLRRKLHGLKNTGGKKFQLKNHGRLAAALLQADEQSRESLSSITDKMYQHLTAAEQQKLRPLILARTLYEFERPSEQHLYRPEEHDARLLKLAKQEKEAQVNIQPVKDLLWFQGWKLNKLSRNETRRARYAHRRHEEKMGEVAEEINTLNYLREGNKKAYSRAMDKVLFTETIKECSQDDLEKMVGERNLDPRIGYLAMVADFVPFIAEGQEDLELRLYRQPITEKVIARQMKKKAITENVNQQLTAASEMELAVAE